MMVVQWPSAQTSCDVLRILGKVVGCLIESCAAWWPPSFTSTSNSLWNEGHQYMSCARGRMHLRPQCLELKCRIRWHARQTVGVGFLHGVVWLLLQCTTRIHPWLGNSTVSRLVLASSTDGDEVASAASRYCDLQPVYLECGFSAAEDTGRLSRVVQADQQATRGSDAAAIWQGLFVSY